MATCWTFAEGSKALTELANRQSRRGEGEKAAVDSCFLGSWLCGNLRFNSLKNAMKWDEVAPSGNTYRFGSGVAKAVRTVKAPIQVGGITTTVYLDIIRGGLPLLCGLSAMAGLGIIVDTPAGQVLQRTGSEIKVLDGYGPGELPEITITPGKKGGEASTKVAYAAWATKGMADVTTTAESGTDSCGISQDSDGDDGEHQWGDWGAPDDAAGTEVPSGIDVAGDALGQQELETQATTDEEMWQVKTGKSNRRRGVAKVVAQQDDGGKKESTNRYAALAEEPVDGSVKRVAKVAFAGENTTFRRKQQQTAERKKALLQAEVKYGSKYGTKEKVEGKEEKKKNKESLAARLEEHLVEADTGDNRECEEKEKLEEPGEKVTKPKVLDTTLKELKKLHAMRHSPPSVLKEFLHSTASREQQEKFAVEFASLDKRIEDACGVCRGCQLSEARTRPGTTIPRKPLKDYMQRAWMDVVCLDKARGFYGLAVVDEGTDDLCLEFVLGKSEEAIFDGLFGRWLSLRGYTELFVSDLGKEFIGEKLLQLLQSYGCAQGHSSAGSAESHGRVERKLRVLRYAEERGTVVRDGPRDEREWRYFLYALENAARNEITKRGYSSSQRAWGRATTLLRTAFDDTPATASVPDDKGVKRLLEVQEAGRSCFYQVIHTRKFRDLLSQRVRPDVRQRGVGEEVWFRDSRHVWRGPGVVRAYDESQMQYEVACGAHLYRPGRFDVKGINEASIKDVNPTQAEKEYADAIGPTRSAKEIGAKAVGPTPEEEEAKKQTVGAELTQARREELLKASQKYKKVSEGKWSGAERDAVAKEVRDKQHVKTKGGNVEVMSMATPEKPTQEFEAGCDDAAEFEAKSDEDEKPKKRRRKKPCSTVPVLYVHGECYYAQEPTKAEDPFESLLEDFMTRPSRRELSGIALVGVKSGADAYGLGWDDVPVHEQKASRQRGVDDFTQFGSWEADEAIACHELRAMDEEVLIFDAHWVDKCKRDGEGRLIGRSRWTPHGFQEWLEKEACRSPTASFRTHVLGEVIGASRGWKNFRYDVSSAFFKSSEIKEKCVYVKIPKEELDRLGLPWRKGGYARRLLKEVPGTKGAPKAWWEELKRALLEECGEESRSGPNEIFVEQSRIDPCHFWGRRMNAAGKVVTIGYVSTHVDDGKGRGQDSWLAWVRGRLVRSFAEEDREGVKWYEGEREEVFCGVSWVYDDDATYLHQAQYIEEELQEVESLEGRKRQEVLSLADRAEAHRAVGQLRWISRTLPYYAQDIWEVSRIPHDQEGCVGDLLSLNKLIRTIKLHARDKEYWWKLPIQNPNDMRVVSVSDAGEPPNDRFYNGCWREGQLLLVGTALVGWHSSRATRVGGGSFGGECIACLGGIERGLGVVEFMGEMDGLGVNRIEEILARRFAPGDFEKPARPAMTAILDAEGVIKSVRGGLEGALTDQSKKRKHDVFAMREMIRMGLLEPLGFIPGTRNPTDPLTKEKKATRNTQGLLWDVIRGKGVNWDDVVWFGEVE